MIHSDLHSNRKCAFRILDNLFFFVLVFPHFFLLVADFGRISESTFYQRFIILYPGNEWPKLNLLGTLKNVFIKIVTEAFIRDLHGTWKAICFSLFTVFSIQAEETARNLETLS